MMNQWKRMGLESQTTHNLTNKDKQGEEKVGSNTKEKKKKK